MMRSVFPDWTADGLRRRLTGAGFGEVSVRIEVGEVRYPSAQEFLRQEAASSPLAGPILELGETTRDSLVSELSSALADRSDDQSVVSPMESWVARARAPGG